MRRHDDSGPVRPPVRLGELVRLCTGELARNLLLELMQGPQDVSHLATRSGWLKSHVSEHLGDLHRAGLLDMRREKQRHIYSLRQDVRVISAPGRLGVEVRSADGSLLRFEQALGPSAARRLGARAERLDGS